MSEIRRTRTRAPLRVGFDLGAAADAYFVEEAMLRYRWERRGLLGRLVRTPIAREGWQAKPSLRRAA